MERAGWWGGGGDKRAVGLRFTSSSTTAEPRHNAGSRVSLAKFVRYNEVLFHMFYYYWGRENRSLYRGLRYKEVRYIEVPLYCYRRKIWIFIFTFMCDQIDQRDTDSTNSNRE